MLDIICSLTAFAVAGFAFVFGAINLFSKKKPLYFQLLIYAVGCFALQLLSDCVLLWCGNALRAVSVGTLGILGCNFFLLSANYGQLDSIVDDGGKQNKPAKIAAIISPISLAVLGVLAFAIRSSMDTFGAIVWAVVLLPALPASYYNTKHLIMPMDDFGFLRATRPCNIAALVFYLCSTLYAITLALDIAVLYDIFTVAMSLSVLAIALVGVKGAEKWGI